MTLCKVLGHVVSTIKHSAFDGRALMIVQPIDEHSKENSSSFVAVDHAQSGPGDTVLVMREGNGVRQILDMGPNVPIRSIIVGIVDQITLEPKS